MNVESIRALADLVEMLPTTSIYHSAGFSMYHTHRACGSPACLAGHAVAMEDGESALPRLATRACIERATEILGLDDVTADALFCPRFPNADFQEDCPQSPAFISARRAVATLRHLAKSGLVVWMAPP